MRPQESVNNSHATDVNWRLFCRLCANEDAQNNINICLKEEHLVSGRTNPNDFSLVDAVRKYFWVDITSVDELPKMLCADCFARVTSMVNFLERVCKVQQMFWALQNSDVNTKLYLQSLRIKYGLLDEEREHVMQCQLPEVHYVEEKPLIDELDENVFELETNANNPLEPTCKTIKTKKKLVKEKEKSENDYDANDASNNNDFGSDCRSEKDDLDDESLMKTKCVRNTRKKKKKIKVTTLQQEDKDTKTTRKRQCRIKSKNNPTKRNDILLDKDKEDTKDEEVQKIAASFEDETETESDDIHDEDFVPPKYNTEKEKETDSNGSQQEVKANKNTKKVKDVVECDVCKKNFPNPSTMRRHRETHESNKHTCPECGLQLNTRSTFREHMKVHSEEMKHKCDFCGRAFKRLGTMKTHRMLHTGLRPYLCEFCGRTFPTSVNCRTHKTLAHRKELAAIEASKGSKIMQNVVNHTQVENNQVSV